MAELSGRISIHLDWQLLPLIGMPFSAFGRRDAVPIILWVIIGVFSMGIVSAGGILWLSFLHLRLPRRFKSAEVPFLPAKYIMKILDYFGKIYLSECAAYGCVSH